MQNYMNITSNNINNSENDELFTLSSGGSSFIWEDDFFDESKIDVEKSYNY